MSEGKRREEKKLGDEGKEETRRQGHKPHPRTPLSLHKVKSKINFTENSLKYNVSCLILKATKATCMASEIPLIGLSAPLKNHGLALHIFGALL